MVLPKTIITLHAIVKPGSNLFKFYQMILVSWDARQVERMQYVQTYKVLHEPIATFH